MKSSLGADILRDGPTATRRRGNRRQIDRPEIKILVAEAQRHIRMHHVLDAATGNPTGFHRRGLRAQRRIEQAEAAGRIDLAVGETARSVNQDWTSGPAQASAKGAVPMKFRGCGRSRCWEAWGKDEGGAGDDGTAPAI